MSILENLTLEERARQLRSPTGATGLAVADMLDDLNREGHLRTIEESQVTPGAMVLEVGCGTGGMARLVLRQADRVNYVGIDSSPIMISTARGRNSDLLGAGQVGCFGPERAPPFARAEYGFHLHDAETSRSFCLAAGFSAVDVETRSLGPEGGPQLVHLVALA